MEDVVVVRERREEERGAREVEMRSEWNREAWKTSD